MKKYVLTFEMGFRCKDDNAAIRTVARMKAKLPRGAKPRVLQNIYPGAHGAVVENVRYFHE